MHKRKIQFHNRVNKFLAKRTETYLRIFYEKLEILAQNPYTDKIDIKKYQGSKKNEYRLRVGKYRFLYRIYEQEILIYFYEADNRGDVY